jgi:hypothetical protein
LHEEKGVSRVLKGQKNRTQITQIGQIYTDKKTPAEKTARALI